ncbi:hypothetical protein O5D80_006675 [Batrachochytrium dendrobatidis]|nr:hypothetical protein O5D80_006675 [Batrachochytrium dendrobatidis]
MSSHPTSSDTDVNQRPNIDKNTIHTCKSVNKSIGNIRIKSRAFTISRGSSSADMRLLSRLIVLFAFGSVLSLLVDSLQRSHHITRWPQSSRSDGLGSISSVFEYAFLMASAWRGGSGSLFSTAGWVPLSCGLSACLMGTLYPLLDQWLLSRQQVLGVRRDWSSALRCCGGFIGISYAASKLTLASSIHMSVTLALLALGLWYLFDRTIHGFVVSFIGAAIGTLVVSMLVQNGVYRYCLIKC